MAPRADNPAAAQATAGDNTNDLVNNGVAFLEANKNSSQEVQNYVEDLYKNHPDQYRNVIDSVFNKVNDDAASDQTLKGLLPLIDLTDNKVDAKGAADDRANFNEISVDGVQTNSDGKALSYSATAQDGKSGMSMDDKGNAIAFSKQADGVHVTSSSQNEVTDYVHTDVDANSVKLDDKGNVTMDRLDPKNPQAGKIGEVTVAPGGAETTHFDKNNTTITRDQSGGQITGFQSDAPGFQNIASGKVPGLDGVHGNKATQDNLPQNVQQDANGNLTYDLPKGIQGHEGAMHVSVNAETGVASFKNDKGEIVQYEDPKSGQVLDRRDDHGDGNNVWWIDKPGQSPSQLEHGVENDPKLSADGKVTYGKNTLGT
jgi:hypothetical protein